MNNKIAIVIAIIAISFGCKPKKKTNTSSEGGRKTGLEVLASNVEYPKVAVNDETIFWSDGDLTRPRSIIYSMPSDGTRTITTLAMNLPYPTTLALDATHLYWVGGGDLTRMDLDGTSTVTLAKCWMSSPLALDAQNVFFGGPFDTVLDSSSIASVPIGGGDITYRHMYGEGLAIDEKNLYAAWGTGGSNGRIMSAPREGGEPVVVADLVPQTSLVAVDDINLYYTNNGVMKFSKADMTKTKLATPLGAISQLYVDGDFLYYVDTGALRTGNLIMRVPIAGGEPVTMAAGLADVVSITSDEQSLYWGALNPNGGVMRFTPK